MKTEKFKRETRISEEILAGLAIKLADKKVEFNEKKLTLSNFRTRLNKEIIALDEEITELANQVHTKHHVENLDCPLNPLPGSKRVELLHPNTGEVVHTRPMTADEAKEGYLFAGINDPEKSADNVAEFFPSNEGEKEATDDSDEDDTTEDDDSADEEEEEDHTAGRGGPDDDALEDAEPEPHPQTNAKGVYLEHQATKLVVDKPELEFHLTIKTILDSTDGLWRSGYRFARKAKPAFSNVSEFAPALPAFTSEGQAIIAACSECLDWLNFHKKFDLLKPSEQRGVIDAIEQVKQEQVVTA